MKRMFLSLSSYLFLYGQQAHAEVWKLQSERLLQVTAALFDSLPLHISKVEGESSLGVRLDVTKIPTIKGKVGGKNENTPTPPVSAEPFVIGTVGLTLPWSVTLGASTWFGVVPRAISSLATSNKVTLQQTSIGGSFQLAPMEFLQNKNIHWNAFMGFQFSSTELSGKLSSAQGVDALSANNTLLFYGLGVRNIGLPFFSELTFAHRTINATYAIADDQNTLTASDTHGAASMAVQGSFGAHLWNQFDVSLAYLWIPERLNMPRASIAWSYSFGGLAL